MFKQEWKTEYQKTEISVTNTWGLKPTLKLSTGIAKLYINGQCVDTDTSTVLLSDKATMRGKISIDDELHTVEVFMKSGFLKMKAKIVVDGEKIAGDNI